VLPTSSLTSPTCTKSGQITASVTSDPDPAVSPKALHLRIDGGAEQVISTAGSPGSATISVPSGTHTLEYWGEDTVGGLENPHNTASVAFDTTPPVVTIHSDQSKVAYAVNEPATLSVAATDDGALQTDPSGVAEPIPTNKTGTFTVIRTAVDQCGNSSTGSFTYTVGTASVTGLRVTPRSFPAASHGGSIARAIGTEISYIDSQAATTTFTVQKKTGRRGRYVKVGSFKRRDVAGHNRFRFTGRVNGHKLRSGRYRLKAIALGPLGKPGRASFTTFRVVG
jgi:hypothetical protein